MLILYLLVLFLTLSTVLCWVSYPAPLAILVAVPAKALMRLAQNVGFWVRQ